MKGEDCVLKHKYALCEGYKNIKKIEGIIGGYAEYCSSFDSRLIVFCSSELGIILLSVSLTPAYRLSPPISFPKIKLALNSMIQNAKNNDTRNSL